MRAFGGQVVLEAEGPVRLGLLALAPEALARALFEQSPFSCVIYDVEGRPLAVNGAFTRLMPGHANVQHQRLFELFANRQHRIQ